MKPIVSMGVFAVAVMMAATIPARANEFDEQGTITPDDVERLLIPVCPPNGLEGRFGAVWGCELWVRNSADVPVVFSLGGPESNLPGGGLIQIDARATGFYAGASRGAMYVVEREHADDVHLSLRIADQTRRPVSEGTNIPIVRERDWLSTPIELLDIPTDPLVRQTLRVYDPDATKRVSVRVTVFPLMGDDPLAQTEIELRGSQDRTPGYPWYAIPDYAEIPDLVTLFPQIASHERVRVRIEPITLGRFWAFITITDNMTQHVTVVSPQ